MLLEQHEITQRALNSGNRILAVGNFWNDIFFPIDAFTTNVFTGTIERLDGAVDLSVAPDQPRPTFASAFGGALGQTTGKFLVYAAIVGGVWFYLKKRRRK